MLLEHQDLAINLNQSVELGSFGPAVKEVAAVSGKEEYNIKMGDKVGVLSDDGRKDDFDSAFDNDFNSPQKKKAAWQTPKETGVNKLMVCMYLCHNQLHA